MAKCYSEENQEQLFKGLVSIRPKLVKLQVALHSLNLKVPIAKEYALHGVARRLLTLVRCVERIFETLPPDLDGVPDKIAVDDATIFLQAFIANTFGVLDNLAHVWAKEMDIREESGEPLSNRSIGLHKKHKNLRGTFSRAMRVHLSDSQSEKWFDNLVNYRDALAHRIPLYITPHCVAHRHQHRYGEINAEISAAMGIGDFEAIAQLEAEQKALTHFRPDYTHSLYEGVESRNIHGQILSDFLTVEELVNMFIRDLNDLHTTI
jgi:hypothetical protein